MAKDSNKELAAAYKEQKDARMGISGSPEAAPTENYSDYSRPQLASYNAPKAPSAGTEWWKPLAYTNNGTNEILANSANALIPTYSPDEATNIGKWLGENFSDFADYKNVQAPSASSNSSSLRKTFFSKDRASQASQNLEAMRGLVGAAPENMGSGYNFLLKTVALLDKYASAEGGISRANFAAMQSEFDELSKNADSAYVELGRAFLNPTSGGNPLMASVKVGNETKFGLANARLFE
jgi:hypothetical protein